MLCQGFLKVCSMHAGSLDVPSAAMERDLAEAGLHMLIEKPISMRPAEEVERLAQVWLRCEFC